MKVFLQKRRGAGIRVFIYLDGILLLGDSKKQVEKDLKTLLQDLVDSGMVINKKKTFGVPNQNLCHLGFQLNLKEGHIGVTPREIKDNKKGTGKISVQNKYELQKDGFHSGGPKILPTYLYTRQAIVRTLRTLNKKSSQALFLVASQPLSRFSMIFVDSAML